jgi:uncharacterized protein YecT (DUF1311 family)
MILWQSIRLPKMFRSSHPFERPFRFVAAIVAAGCALANSAPGQVTSGQLSANCAAYASVPLPAAASDVSVPKAFPACASYRSYRGIGRPANYDEARACAWQERAAQKANLAQNPKEPTAWFVGGPLILADIYFNGAGVQRNVPLAMRFACEADKGMVALALDGVAKWNGSHSAQRPFEFCDYASTTLTMSFCSEYASEIADDRRNRYYVSLKASMTADQRAAFDKLLAAEHAYITTHAFEVDQGGSIRGIRTLNSQGILEDLFRAEVVHFERKEWPALSACQIATADEVLQREYEEKLQQLGKQSQEDIEGGAVTAEGLSKAEKAWGAYREAWVGFARARYPAAADAIGAQITLDRYRLVKTIG